MTTIDRDKKVKNSYLLRGLNDVNHGGNSKKVKAARKMKFKAVMKKLIARVKG